MFTSRLAVPEFVRVTDMFLLALTEILPNAIDGGLDVNFGVPTTTPVPLIGIDRVDGDALLTIETEPVAAPALVGEKLKVADADCDGFSMNGVVIGETLKTLPDTVT